MPRLLALVIHALWEGSDQAPLIMPASVPLAESAVGIELARHLKDTWKPILDADADVSATRASRQTDELIHVA